MVVHSYTLSLLPCMFSCPPFFPFSHSNRLCFPLPRPPLFFPLFHFLDFSLPGFPSCFLCVCLCGDRREGDGAGCECWEKGGRLVSNSVMRCLAMPASALLPRINGSLTCHVPRGPTGRRRAGLMRPRHRDTCRGRDGRVCYAETSGA